MTIQGAWRLDTRVLLFISVVLFPRVTCDLKLVKGLVAVGTWEYSAFTVADTASGIRAPAQVRIRRKVSTQGKCLCRVTGLSTISLHI